MDLEQLKSLLKRYRLTPNFTFGQNFLIDDIVLRDIVDAAEVSSRDNILEIGPGIGNLTRVLCERAGFVLSIEKDPKFSPILKSIKKDYPDNFRFEIVDVLEYDFQKFFRSLVIHKPSSSGVIPRSAADRGPQNFASNFGVAGEGSLKLSKRDSSDAFRMTPKDLSVQRRISVPISDGSAAYKVVANIPYYITGKIIKMLLTAKFKPSSITILTQKEVAQNLSASPGDLGILAISVQLFGQPKLVQTVLARSFFPAPKVDSAIVRIDVNTKPKYKLDDEKRFFKIVKACFAGKRKQIHNTLVNNLHLEKNEALKILSQLKINPAARPQELTIEQWVALTQKIVASS